MDNLVDWRLTGQEKYLFGVLLHWSTWRPPEGNPDWDHDHCEFCGQKFMLSDSSEAQQEGYTTEDRYHWICRKCFKDFKDRFQWNVKKEYEVNPAEGGNNDRR